MVLVKVQPFVELRAKREFLFRRMPRDILEGEKKDDADGRYLRKKQKATQTTLS